MTQEYVELTLTADVDGDGTDETGTFEGTMGDDQGQPMVVTGEFEMLQVIGQEGTGALDTFTNLLSGQSEKRKDVTVDLGMGRRVKRLEFTHQVDRSDQWGDGSGSLPADGTDKHPLEREAVLDQYIAHGTYDSRDPAKLAYGPYASGQPLDELDIMPINATCTWTSDKTGILDVAIDVVVVGDLLTSDATTNRTSK